MTDSEPGMETTGRPVFALYVAWRPSYKEGGEVADLLRGQFNGERHRNIAGGHGLSVIYRSESMPGSDTPLPIDWNESEMTAVVVLADSTLADDPAWRGYIDGLSKNANTKGFASRLFPVMMESEGPEPWFDEQALLWGDWEGRKEKKAQRLIRELTHEFCRMLRHRLGSHDESQSEDTAATSYLKKIQVFISHSKHDEDGKSIARSVRNWIHEHGPVSSFFDVHDIPAGTSFKEVLYDEIKNSAVVALHTDSYSSREWCRREIIEAKRCHVPMVVVDCLRDVDPRVIPYMGNVPTVRISLEQPDARIGDCLNYLLDEVFLDYLWRCRVQRFGEAHPEVSFVSRPPELISLTALSGRLEGRDKIVYPEPLVSAEDARLFQEVAPRATIQTLAEWLEEIR